MQYNGWLGSARRLSAVETRVPSGAGKTENPVHSKKSNNNNKNRHYNGDAKNDVLCVAILIFSASLYKQQQLIIQCRVQ